MKVEIDVKELEQLLNDSYKLELLNQGGVDNWEWYGESLEDFHNYKPDLTSYGVLKNLKYSKGSKVYYNNNEALFVSYLTEDVAVIIVQAFPDFDSVKGEQWCTPCMIGGTSSHTCDMANEIIDVLEDNSSATDIPLIVSTKMLYDKPLIVNTHEKVVEDLLVKQKETLEKTKELSLKNIDLEAKNKSLEDKIKMLEELNKI